MYRREAPAACIFRILEGNGRGLPQPWLFAEKIFPKMRRFWKIPVGILEKMGYNKVE
jgi:hypothetical protein